MGYMCGRNIAAKTYYHGGMLVATTPNIDRMARTARQMSEAQRDSYEALTENLAAAQRRSVGLAQDGLKFFRLQEENARAAQQWFASSVRVAQLQQRNTRFAQDWLREGAEALREQTEHNVRTVEAFTRSARKQQEGFQALAQGWTEAYEGFSYEGFFFSPFNYAQEGLRAAQKATEQTEEATREVELRTSVIAALETEDYDELSVAEVTKRLDDLSADELKKLREFEKRNKDRESLVELIDRKIRANS